ncbi:MAG TPA: hypothetical protein DCW68_05740 [Rhodospirillaceae bacterium]|nr:MAG: hypothetical protein A2018_01920 [Alphaproteobacteria bacterium GWF2_58_20]HAU29595.1 hypothetical protein [Rhodospirillaceae bacterium]
MAGKFVNAAEINQRVRQQFASGQNVRASRKVSSRPWMLTALLAVVFAGGMAQAQIVPQVETSKNATDTLILENDGWNVSSTFQDIATPPVSPPVGASMTVLYNEKTWAPACGMSGKEMFDAMASGTLCVCQQRFQDMEQLDEKSFAVVSAILMEERGSPGMQAKMEDLADRALEQFRNILVLSAPAPAPSIASIPPLVPALR